MELVERAAQLRTLRGAFESAARGHGRTVLVSGKAGIGKTSLLRCGSEPSPAPGQRRHQDLELTVPLE
jgi:predicted ATPase